MGAELEAERAAALSEETDERELERFEKQAERRYQRTRLRASLIVLGAMLALVASINALPAGLEVLATAKPADEAKAAVTDYLSALSSGDGARASEFVPDAASEQSKWQRANDMLANAVERITIVEIGEPDTEHPGDKVIDVPATVSLAGATYGHVITVALENDRWQIMRASEQLSGDVTAFQ